MPHIHSFSFCETSTSGPLSRWHIRPLTSAGKKLGGGADTEALCGRVVAWDLIAEITDHHLTHSCPACVKAYQTTKDRT